MQTSLFSSWLPSMVAFAGAFIVASLLSAFTYWVAHLSLASIRWVKITSSAVSTFAFGLLVGVGGFYANMNPLPVLVFPLVIVLASGVQAFLEQAIDENTLAFTHQFARSFFTYLSTLFIGYLIAALVIAEAARAILRGSAPSWDLMASLYGLLAGVVIAPLSISFYRRMFQSLPLRPGIDRLLSEDELAA